MFRHVMQVAAAAAFLAVPAIGGAHAQQIGQVFVEGDPDPAYFARPGVVVEGRSVFGEDRVCLKLCEADTNPCDPTGFKQADGRCTRE